MLFARIGARTRARSRDADASWMLAVLSDLVRASRRSSESVLRALHRGLLTLDPRLDGMLVFVPDGDELACVYAAGTRAEHFRRVRLRRDDRLLPARAAQSGCRALLSAGASPMLPSDRFAVATPLYDGSTLFAIAYVSSASAFAAAPSDAIVAAAERAATPLAIALEREADRSDATHDDLTGLLAPRAFRSRLDEEIARAGGGDDGRVLALWFVDADRFKDVNDGFGHRIGDAVLRKMAALLQTHLVAGVDVAGRNGGDEFCVLLRGTSKVRAIDRAQAFCDAVRLHDFELAVRVTASVGVAVYPYDARSASALLDVADAAMYHSKRDGRDRVSFAVGSGTLTSLRSEAEAGVSRTASRCGLDSGES